MKVLFSIAGVAVLLSGCASDRIVGPAQQANAVLTKLRSDLSQYQSQYALVDAAFQNNLNAIIIAKQSATANTNILVDVMSLPSTTKPIDLFTALQSQGKAYTAAALAPVPASTTPAAPSLPFTKIDGVIKELGQLGTAQTVTDDAAFLNNFAQQTNTDLTNLQKSATKTPAVSTSPQTQ